MKFHYIIDSRYIAVEYNTISKNYDSEKFRIFFEILSRKKTLTGELWDAFGEFLGDWTVHEIPSVHYIAYNVDGSTNVVTGL